MRPGNETAAEPSEWKVEPPVTTPALTPWCLPPSEPPPPATVAPDRPAESRWRRLVGLVLVLLLVAAIVVEILQTHHAARRSSAPPPPTRHGVSAHALVPRPTA